MDTTVQNHDHNGVSSKKLDAGQAIVNAPQAAITAPTGGGVIDAEARTAINDILTALQTLHLIR